MESFESSKTLSVPLSTLNCSLFPCRFLRKAGTNLLSGWQLWEQRFLLSCVKKISVHPGYIMFYKIIYIEICIIYKMIYNVL